MPPIQRHNFRMLQLEGIGVALANAALPFLPVFLARLGASNFQVGLLIAMPAATGLLLSVAVGGWLLSQPSVAAWFARARCLSTLAFALTGVVTLVLPSRWSVAAVLLIWALATVPQIIATITGSVIVNAVAGPRLRVDLLSRRWSAMGLITAACIALTGQLLKRQGFPFNFQLAFIALSAGGLSSAFFAKRLRLPDAAHVAAPAQSVSSQWRLFSTMLKGQPAFIAITSRRFLYMAGVMLAAPIVPLYYVRVARADDAAIGLIATAHTLTLLIGYRLWTRISERRGPRVVLLLTTLALAVYPALMASTQVVPLIVALAALAGIFQGGFDLVVFDELMQRVPSEHAPLFVSFDQGAQNLAAVASPLIGTLLADRLGLGGALLVSAGLRLVAFAWFAMARPSAEIIL